MADDVSDQLTPGVLLRAARSEKKLTVTDAAEALRTREKVITALENDDYSVFSADMYARGFIRNYAQLLNLDPTPLLHTYQESFAKNDPDVSVPPRNETGPLKMTAPPRANLRMVFTAGVIAVIAVVTIVSVALGGRTPDTATVDDIVDVVPEPALPPDSDAPPVDVEPEPEPVVPATGVDLVLTFEQASWMQILVDGVLVLEETVQAGETLQYRGDEVRVRFGNAGGVFADLNGEALGIQGGRGEVKNVRYTRDGADVS